MRKIALLSPFSPDNFGTMLQAYALARAINEMGGCAEYISYNPFPNKKGSFLLMLIRHPLLFIDLLKQRQKRKKDLDYSFMRSDWFSTIMQKNQAFIDDFIPHTQEVYFFDTISKIGEQYDVYIVGSDQTWSPFIDFYRYRPYYLHFVKGKKKCSYAPSFGVSSIPQSHLDYVKKHLASFDLISVRESSSAEVLTRVLNREVPVVLDPTILLPRDEWRKIMLPYSTPNKYILCYILGEKDCIVSYAEFLAREKKLPILFVPTRPKYHNMENHLPNVGVREFLSLIEGSSYVITDSFHGTVFSIIFQREFVSFGKRNSMSGDNGRIMDLLTQFSLSDHFMRDEDFMVPPSVDYSVVESHLHELRASSKKYLIDVIK